jgi:hypothetical protein
LHGLREVGDQFIRIVAEIGEAWFVIEDDPGYFEAGLGRTPVHAFVRVDSY